MRATGFPQDVKLQRAEAWVAAWSAIQHSTELVDRDRAERAMSALYAECGLGVPAFIWVDTPSDGVLAWHVASRGQEPLLNVWTRGDHGTGNNRRLYALQDPFGLEPAWRRRALRRARVHAPDDFDPEGGYSVHDRAVFSAIDDKILTAHQASRSGWWQGSRVSWSDDESAPPRVFRSTEPGLARRVIGDRWEELEAIMGSELLVDVALDALAGTTNHILDVRPSLAEALSAMTFPQYDRTTIAMGALPEVLGHPLWRQLDEREERTAMVERRLELARTGAAFWAFERLAILMERPDRIRFDSSGRLHAHDGPALAYADRLEVWADHGVVVPKQVITAPEMLTVADIDAQSNAEIRRVMVERYGSERLIREGGAELVEEDATGRLWRRPHTNADWREEPVVMVEVKNSTNEPDGSVRTYFLRVPASMQSARAAVAWTFGLQEQQYRPLIET